MSTSPSPIDSRGGRTLDAPPPLPRSTSPSSNLVANQMSATGEGLPSGPPQVMALQGLATVEKGLEMIGTALPDLAPAIVQLKDELRQVIPQAMAAGQSQGGGLPTGAEGAMAPPSGPPGGGGMPSAGGMMG